MGYAHSRWAPQLLMELALGRVRECPFNVEEIQTLKQNTMGAMERAGIKVERMSGDRSDLPIDYRYVDALLRAAEDPEVNLGSFAGGVRVGPGVRMPRLPALFTKKKRWMLPDQADPMAYQEERAAEEGVWRQNYSSLAEWSGECVKILDDQAEREQVLKMSEVEARRRFPELAVASLGGDEEGETRRRGYSKDPV